MNPENARQITNEVFALYEQYGKEDYIGEPVSQLEHMCQAAQLAEKEGYDDEVILAAFFHDIGHLCEYIMDTRSMEGFGVTDHEYIAGNYLRGKGFSEKIAQLAESHVLAKRYLTYKDPAYLEKLSEASRITLGKQGGIMTAGEAELFEQDQLYPLYIKLREWDDRAKLEHQPLPALDGLRQKAFHHLLHQK